MGVCEVCGESSAEIIACRQCGVRFCPECGYQEKHLCFDCGTGEEESDEDKVDDTLEESTETDFDETYGEEDEEDEEKKDALEKE